MLANFFRSLRSLPETRHLFERRGEATAVLPARDDATVAPAELPAGPGSSCAAAEPAAGTAVSGAAASEAAASSTSRAPVRRSAAAAPFREVQPLFREGEEVSCRWRKGSRWYEGTIRRVRPTPPGAEEVSYDIDYKDGDEEEDVRAAWIRPRGPRAGAQAAAQAAGRRDTPERDEHTPLPKRQRREGAAGAAEAGAGAGRSSSDSDVSRTKRRLST